MTAAPTEEVLSRPRRLAERERTLLAYERGRLPYDVARHRIFVLDRDGRPPHGDVFPAEPE